jgi:hypothetical protein
MQIDLENKAHDEELLDLSKSMMKKDHVYLKAYDEEIVPHAFSRV